MTKTFGVTVPPTITSLTKKSNIYKFHNTIFDILIKDRSLKKINYLAKQLFLNTAEKRFLDLIGQLYGVSRKDEVKNKEVKEESDSDFRKHIEKIKEIMINSANSPGIPREAIKKFLEFYSKNLNINSIDDEHDLTIRILKNKSENSDEDKSEKLSFITSHKRTWSRAYIRFFNMPGINIDLIKRTLDDIVEPYQGVYLMPYTGKKAIKKILDHYKLKYNQLERKRNKEN